MHHRHSGSATSRARDLRSRATDAERRLWYRLRDFKQLGYHFRRQAPFETYFLDFVEHSAKLAVELDGNQHGVAEQSQHDAERDAFLASRGYRTLRFWNYELNDDLDAAVEAILRELRARHPHPARSARRPPRKGEVEV